MYLFHITFRRTAKGQVPRLVPCEQCGQEYVYVLRRTAVGHGTSFVLFDIPWAQRRAQAQAEARLAKRLECDCDPVPCPACGWYQEHMLPRIRTLRRRWMKKLGIALLPISFLLFAFGGVALVVTQLDPHILWVPATFFVASLLALLAAPTLPLLRWLWCRRYDPNDEDVEARKLLGRSRAVGKEEYLRLVEQGRA